MKYIQSKYGEGMLKNWDKICEIVDPEYPSRFYETIKENNILPKELDGFVFLSPSANKGSKEIGLAQIIDQQLQNTELKNRPLFIASDFFGSRDRKGIFKPCFDIKKVPKLNKVEFHFVSADANKLPIEDHTVDIIMDRMGAIWHTINSCLSNESQPIIEISKNQKEKAQEKVKIILKHYLSKLKKGGSIIIDAPDDTRESTAKLLLTIFDGNIGQQLKQVGLEYLFIGEENNRLLVLHELTQSENK